MTTVFPVDTNASSRTWDIRLHDMATVTTFRVLGGSLRLRRISLQRVTAGVITTAFAVRDITDP